MISKEIAERVLGVCLRTGGDFAELFVEDTVGNSLQVTGAEVSDASTRQSFGAAVRIFKGLSEVYGYSNDLSEDGLLKLAGEVSSAYEGEPTGGDFILEEQPARNAHPVERPPAQAPNAEKIGYLLATAEAVMGYSDEISQAVVTLTDETQRVLIATTEGNLTCDERTHTRIAVTAVGTRDGRMQQAHESLGRHRGLEILDEHDLRALARGVAEACVTMLHAEEMEGQTLPVVIHNAFGGVIFHEACGHSLEATSVARNLSVFSGKLSEQIASELVTAVDDGTIANAWGSANVDDEGTSARRNVLIEKGVLMSYMIDKRNARRMRSGITGSARRQSYRFPPTSRMTNTFIENGESTFDEIIASTPYGFFARRMGGGSVNPITGEFNFAVSEGYMIEQGRITRPVRGATLVGSGAEVLKKIDMVGNNLAYGQGMCGSVSGMIPADVGQPTIRVSSLTVGGTGGAA